MNDISVVIPSYNSTATIQCIIPKFLKFLRNKVIMEIIVVDSSQEKNGIKLSPEYEHKIRIIRLLSQTHPSIARNIGAGAASGEILAFFDADTYPDDSWFEKVQNAYNEGCMIGGGTVLVPSFQKKKVIPLAQYCLQLNEQTGVGIRRPKKFVLGCNLFCKKELFEKVGGFPNIRAGEEVLFGFKVGKLEKIWFIPEARAHHIFREDLKGFLKNQMLLGKYNFIYRRRFYNSFIYKWIFPLMFTPFIFFLKLLRIVLRISMTGFKNVLILFYCFPLFILGLIFWAIGFARAGIIGNDMDIE